MEHEERDRDVLAGDRDERERVEELVVAEDRGREPGAPERVDESTDRVGEAADAEQHDSRRTGVRPDLRHREDTDPAERETQ